MVLIHELGHYTTAKILGFTIEEFSVGFGPKIFSKRRKNGELFSLRVLPLGGFCSFLGEDDDEQDKSVKEQTQVNSSAADVNADESATTSGEKTSVETQDKSHDDDLLSYVMKSKIDEDSAARETAKALDKPVRLDKNGNPALTFNQQKPWKRIIVLLGGVVFNFLSAIIFSLIYIWAVGCPAPQIVEVKSFDGVPYCDLQKGDIIVGVNGTNISVMNPYNDLMSGIKEGQTVTFKVDRGGKIVTVEATKQKINDVDNEGKPYTYVGFGFVSSTEFVGGNAANAFKYCVPYTFKLSWAILGSFGQLITGKMPITSVSGPVGSVKLMAEISIANWRNILILLPLLASNLAMFNLLPFPALDGARVIFTTVEWIRKKPNNRKVEGMINFIGLAVLLLFVLIVDILSFAL
ncbi:MAG: site-2 protease family protein [Clostridiales bacterium]|nr:site-2 protease family protein [Clostridiales bacterium]